MYFHWYHFDFIHIMIQNLMKIILLNKSQRINIRQKVNRTVKLWFNLICCPFKHYAQPNLDNTTILWPYKRTIALLINDFWERRLWRGPTKFNLFKKRKIPLCTHISVLENHFLPHSFTLRWNSNRKHTSYLCTHMHLFSQSSKLNQITKKNLNKYSKKD